MPLGSRVAIGRCNCVKPYPSAIQARACEAIGARLENWRNRLPADLAALPNELHEEERVEGHWITFGTYKHQLDGGATLVVFPALVHTWARPTFLSIGAVGRMYAEGLVVSASGEVKGATDSNCRRSIFKAPVRCARAARRGRCEPVAGSRRTARRASG